MAEEDSYSPEELSACTKDHKEKISSLQRLIKEVEVEKSSAEQELRDSSITNYRKSELQGKPGRCEEIIRKHKSVITGYEKKLALCEQSRVRALAPKNLRKRYGDRKSPSNLRQRNVEKDVPFGVNLQSSGSFHESDIKFEKLTLKNIKNLLKRNGFSSSDAAKLGEQLDEVSPGDINTMIGNNGGIGGDWDNILTAIISHWLSNDVTQSWEKLAQALSNCGHKVIASDILGTPQQVKPAAQTGPRQRKQEIVKDSEEEQEPTEVQRPKSGKGTPTKSWCDQNKVVWVIGVCLVVGVGLLLGFWSKSTQSVAK